MPGRYLTLNYFCLDRFTDLKDGLAFLKMRVDQRSDGPSSFCKANLTTFLDCQEALEGRYHLNKS